MTQELVITETHSASIPLDAIVVLEDANPRKTFDDAQLKELANSIKSIGLLNPITVQATETEGQYRLIAGHRRFLAVSSLKLPTIDAVIYPAEWTDASIAAVAENVARADLNPVDEARAYRELATAGKAKPKQLAALVGRSEKHVKERLALLDLPEAVLELFAAGALSPRVAPVLYQVAKLSPDVTTWLAVVASQSTYATEQLVHNLAGALKDLRKSALTISPDATPPFVLQCQDYMVTENREILRRVISDELATKISELPVFVQHDPWRMGGQDGDAAVAYGAALDLSTGHYRTVFVLDPEWAADRVAQNYEHALKRALEYAAQTKAAREPGGHEHVHVVKREDDKARRNDEAKLAPRVHERNAAIGRALMKHKFKADPMAIKLLAVLAAGSLNSTPASAWALADESIGKPEVTTRKDGSTKFKLVVAQTPFQLQQDLVQRVHEAKTVPQLLRLILAPIIAGSVIDGRSVTQSNRPARLNFQNLAGTQDVLEYLQDLAREFDFEKPYETPRTAEELAAEAAEQAALDALEVQVETLRLAAEEASVTAEQADDDETQKHLEAEAETAWKAYEQAEQELDALISGCGAPGDDADEDEDEDESGDLVEQPVFDPDAPAADDDEGEAPIEVEGDPETDSDERGPEHAEDGLSEEEIDAGLAESEAEDAVEAEIAAIVEEAEAAA